MAGNDQYLIPGLFPFSRLCGNPVYKFKIIPQANTENIDHANGPIRMLVYTDLPKYFMNNINIFSR